MFKRQKRFSLTAFPLHAKAVLVRVDYNVPLKGGKVVNNYKIQTSLPTINYLLSKNCKVILATHLGRPQGEVNKELSTKIVAKELSKLLGKVKVHHLSDCIGKKVANKVEEGKPKEVFMLENLRFYAQEKENDPVFAQSLACLADVYINEAFGVAHREHASLDAITSFLACVGGFWLEKEIAQLNKIHMSKPPAVWILGGAKLGKINLVHQALRKADHILIGGALAFSFLRAKGVHTGMSKIDQKSINAARKILKTRHAAKIILPSDFVVTKTFSARAAARVVSSNQIQSTDIGLDIGPKTVELFSKYLRGARTIFWNGPLGYYEWTKFAAATKQIGRTLSKLTATTVCGGGETSAAILKFHLEHKITHLSTGGGAALAYLSGEKLPAIEALQRNYIKFRKKTR